LQDASFEHGAGGVTGSGRHGDSLVHSWGVIDVVLGIRVLRHEMLRSQEEHVIARFARIQERRFFRGAPRGDQPDTADIRSALRS